MSETNTALTHALRIDAGEAKAPAGGHRWMRCPRCGQSQLKPASSEGNGCVLTPGCPGKVADVCATARAKHGEREADPRCSRAGCWRRAFVRTARGESVCRVCLAALASLARDPAGPLAALAQIEGACEGPRPPRSARASGRAEDG